MQKAGSLIKRHSFSCDGFGFISGNYFGSHFIMGGERFDMSQPESYLFGENTDLNFLGCKPIPVSCDVIFPSMYSEEEISFIFDNN